MEFKHNKDAHPSSLILDVIVWNDFEKFYKEKGIIDTGADRTAIPDYLASTLGLTRVT